MRTLASLLISGGILMMSGAAFSREPSGLEQYYLELVNRARANPNGEVTRLSSSPWGDDEENPVPANLNEGLAPGTISASAKQPLAFDTRLIDSASDYSDFLLATEQFSHTANGTASTRMTSAGYSFTSPSIAGENLATTASTGPYPLDRDRVDDHHSGLFIDGGVTGRGHRINLLLADYREIGIAIRADSDGVSIFGSGFNEILSAQNLAKSAGRVFVTGVIYSDTNTNSFYDPGESAGILALEVRTTGGVTRASGTSFSSGGYSINLNGVASGTYDLVAIDAFGSEKSTSFAWTGSENVKVDLVNPNFIAPPVFGIPYRPDGRIGITLTSLTGNDLYTDTAVGQTIWQTANSAVTMKWHARFENDGSEIDTVRTIGTQGNRFFRVTYLMRNGNVFSNATASILTGFNDALQNGEESAYQIHLKTERAALGRRNSHSFSLRAVSSNDGSKADRVSGLLLNRTKKSRR